MELKALTVVWAINHNQHYLFGRPFSGNIPPLCQLCKMKDPCNLIARWIMKLQEYDYQPTKLETHLEPDCLVHHPQPMQAWDMDGNNTCSFLPWQLEWTWLKSRIKIQPFGS